MSDTERRNGFDESEIRAAERALEVSLAAADPTPWVFDYTEDAVFDAGGHPVRGRAALLEMATGMRPLSEVSIRPLRTEGSAGLATVWRKESDDRWRVALEHIA